jgi:hypothetical protein
LFSEETIPQFDSHIAFSKWYSLFRGTHSLN